MAGYIRDSILSESTLKFAKDYCTDSKDWYDVFQYYNLFNLKRLDVPSEDWYKFDEIIKYSRRKDIIGFYFLKYIPGSFTRFHADHSSELTIVTMIDSKDLVGGDCLIMDTYNAPEYGRPERMTCVRTIEEKENPPYGRTIIPEVVTLKDGESMIYGNELTHAVSRVHKGHRLVLISWHKS